MTLREFSPRPGGRRDTFNPYRVTVNLFLNRFRWDLHPAAWAHRRKLRALRDCHSGKSAVILCNGPSLRDVDFGKIRQVFTFGLNKINLLFEETDFRPSAIVAVNPYVIAQNAQFYATTEIPLFLGSAALRQGVRQRENVYLLHIGDFPYFARDCSYSVFEGFTVTYVALQLAYHMGFRRVALVGCDHDFHLDGKPNEVTYNAQRDISHFSERYFAPSQPWQFPDLKASELYYELARRCYEADSRLLINASTRSKLDVFPRTSLEAFLDGA